MHENIPVLVWYTGCVWNCLALRFFPISLFRPSRVYPLFPYPRRNLRKGRGGGGLHPILIRFIFFSFSLTCYNVSIILYTIWNCLSTTSNRIQFKRQTVYYVATHEPFCPDFYPRYASPCVASRRRSLKSSIGYIIMSQWQYCNAPRCVGTKYSTLNCLQTKTWLIHTSPQTNLHNYKSPTSGGSC